jgi:hypothetical protein
LSKEDPGHIRNKGKPVASFNRARAAKRLSEDVSLNKIKSFMVGDRDAFRTESLAQLS